MTSEAQRITYAWLSDEIARTIADAAIIFKADPTDRRLAALYARIGFLGALRTKMRLAPRTSAKAQRSSSARHPGLSSSH